MQTSETITKVVGAIAKVQETVGAVTKGSKNPHFGNTYADLNTFLHALEGPMREQGLTLIQAPGMREGWVTVETLLAHSSGEWVRSEAGAPMPKADPQGAGSAITYLRRYSLAALFALPQEDDDGNAGSGVGRDQATGEPRQAARKPSGADATCPKCGGGVWDNRKDKKSPKAPDYKCKDKDGCDWAFWVDGAIEKLDEAVMGLVQSGTVTEEAGLHVLAGVQDGDLGKLKAAQVWVNDKRDEGRMGA